MARYHVAWNAKKNTATIVPFGESGSKSDEVIGDIYLPVVGEVPDAAPAPEPAAHLRNLIMKQGVPDYRLATIVNKTDHEGFERFTREPDEAFVKDWETREAAKLRPGNKEAAVEAAKAASKDKAEPAASPAVSTDSTDGQQNGPTT